MQFKTSCDERKKGRNLVTVKQLRRYVLSIHANASHHYNVLINDLQVNDCA